MYVGRSSVPLRCCARRGCHPRVPTRRGGERGPARLSLRRRTRPTARERPSGRSARSWPSSRRSRREAVAGDRPTPRQSAHTSSVGESARAARPPPARGASASCAPVRDAARAACPRVRTRAPQPRVRCACVQVEPTAHFVWNVLVGCVSRARAGQARARAASVRAPVRARAARRRAAACSARRRARRGGLQRAAARGARRHAARGGARRVAACSARRCVARDSLQRAAARGAARRCRALLLYFAVRVGILADATTSPRSTSALLLLSSSVSDGARGRLSIRRALACDAELSGATAHTILALRI